MCKGFPTIQSKQQKKKKKKDGTKIGPDFFPRFIWFPVTLLLNTRSELSIVDSELMEYKYIQLVLL